MTTNEAKTAATTAAIRVDDGRLSLWIPGPAPTQGSMRALVNAQGRARIIHDRHDKLAHWRKLMRDLIVTLPAEQAQHLPLHGALMLGCAVAYPRPRAHYRTNGSLRATAPAHITTRPDLDKILRAVCDALTISGAWNDDRQVVTISAYKTYAADPLEVGTEILLRRPLST